MFVRLILLTVTEFELQRANFLARKTVKLKKRFWIKFFNKQKTHINWKSPQLLHRLHTILLTSWICINNIITKLFSPLKIIFSTSSSTYACLQSTGSKTSRSARIKVFPSQKTKHTTFSHLSIAARDSSWHLKKIILCSPNRV